MFAVSSTIAGFIPPSSSRIGVRFFAAACATIFPTKVLPVKKMKSNESFRSSVFCSLPPATTVTALGSKYFDPSAVTVVAGGREQNTELLKLSFDFIFFTGSTFVGKIVAQAAAKNLTPVLLELGGMNPAIVDETANIPDAAKKIVWGAMAWGGQWCTSPGYAY